MHLLTSVQQKDLRKYLARLREDRLISVCAYPINHKPALSIFANSPPVSSAKKSSKTPLDPYTETTITLTITSPSTPSNTASSTLRKRSRPSTSPRRRKKTTSAPAAARNSQHWKSLTTRSPADSYATDVTTLWNAKRSRPPTAQARNDSRA